MLTWYILDIPSRYSIVSFRALIYHVSSEAPSLIATLPSPPPQPQHHHHHNNKRKVDTDLRRLREDTDLRHLNRLVAAAKVALGTAWVAVVARRGRRWWSTRHD
ncbi:hypothetical protein PIB30_069313 [Stylosanthes scabra]|uniref:Uncharacterized protein n=1 Tax=Stylosanthes scabra TaxID=79078 RepID=A0ABU6WN12_9FABA|nr:hypothetical protein [Stylosanthes scabra]